MPEGTPLHGDRGAWDVGSHADEHASDIDAAALLRHLPAPAVAGEIAYDNGINWVKASIETWLSLTGGELNFNPSNPALFEPDIGVITEYSTIQGAINAASDYDVVLIPTGAYTENLTVASKSVMLASAFSLVDITGNYIYYVTGSLTVSGSGKAFVSGLFLNGSVTLGADCMLSAINAYMLDITGTASSTAHLSYSEARNVSTLLGLTTRACVLLSVSGITTWLQLEVAATATNAGIVELAADAEALAKALTTRALTPANLAALGASITFAGLIELATDAEVQTGTDTGRAVTPAGLATYGPRVRAKRSTAQTIATATFTIVQYNTEDWDLLGEWDAATNFRFTPTKAGYYRVSATFLFDNVSTLGGTEFVQLRVYKNGAGYATLDRQDDFSGGTVYPFLSGTTTVYLNGTTDYIDVRAYQNSGGDLSSYADASYNFVDIEKI